MRLRRNQERGWRRHTAEVRRNLDPIPADVTGAGGVWAVGMVKDEADVIETVIRHLLAEGVERVLIADNNSSDGTEAILERLAQTEAVTVLSDRLTAYYQAEKMTVLARAAVRAGAGWVIPFDADEVWLATGTTLAQWLAACDADVVQVPVINHVPTADDDLSEPDPVRRLRWRKTSPNRLHKVAFRAHRRARLHYGNHGVHRPGRRTRGLEIRHFPYRSEEQFVRKLRQGSTAMVTSDLSDEVCKHWRGLGTADDDGMRESWRQLLETHNLPSEWWVPQKGLVEDPVPSLEVTPES